MSTNIGRDVVSIEETTKQQNYDNQDVISKIIGDFGKWQLHLTFFLALFNLPCTWHIYAMTFQAPDVEFWCAPPKELQWLSLDEWRNISHTPSLNHVSKNPSFH